MSSRKTSGIQNLKIFNLILFQSSNILPPPHHLHVFTTTARNNNGTTNTQQQHTTGTHELNIKRMSKRKREILTGTDYIGVKKNKQRYQAQIFINGKHYYPGTYDTPIEAANAYDIAAIEAVRKKKEVFNSSFLFFFDSFNEPFILLCTTFFL